MSSFDIIIRPVLRFINARRDPTRFVSDQDLITRIRAGEASEPELIEARHRGFGYVVDEYNKSRGDAGASQT